MRPIVLILVLVFPLLAGCKRAKLTTQSQPSNKELAANSSREVAGAGTPAARQKGADGVGGREQPGAPALQPPPTNPAAPTSPLPPPASARGNMTIRVYDTPLDYILYALTVRDGTFRLNGQGTNYVGRIGRSWRAMLGQPIAIEPSIIGVGDSALDLPQVGTVKVLSGRMILDEVIRQNPLRVKGRIEFALPGPEGPSSYSGTFEVGVVTE